MAENLDTFGVILAGMGIVGVVLSFILGSILLFVLPIWALVNCVMDEERDIGPKIILVILLIFTWGLGSFLYGFFVTSSRALRRTTIFSTLLLIGLIVLSLSSVLVSGGIISINKGFKKNNAIESQQISSNFLKTVKQTDESVEPFYALYLAPFSSMMPESASVTRFTLKGPNMTEATPTDRILRQIAFDPVEGLYALTDHSFGTINPGTGEFSEVRVDAGVRDNFSWPRGIAIDRENKKVIIMTSHVYNRFFSYDPVTVKWQELGSNRSRSYVSLAYSSEQRALYSLVKPENNAISEIAKFNIWGEHVYSIKLSPAIPIRESTNFLQISHQAGKLMVIVPKMFVVQEALPEIVSEQFSGVFMVDEVTGQVSIAAAETASSN